MRIGSDHWNEIIAILVGSTRQHCKIATRKGKHPWCTIRALTLELVWGVGRAASQGHNMEHPPDHVIHGSRDLVDHVIHGSRDLVDHVICGTRGPVDHVIH